MRTCIVIGSGIAGIASSIRLSKLGYGVTVYEANNYPGGKLSSFQQGDYRFDAGPSLFTMPMFVDELFELCGENPRDHFEQGALPRAVTADDSDRLPRGDVEVNVPKRP